MELVAQYKIINKNIHRGSTQSYIDVSIYFRMAMIRDMPVRTVPAKLDNFYNFHCWGSPFKDWWAKPLTMELDTNYKKGII